MSIPVFILTGFLGSGKTTLLNRLIALPGPRSAIIVNEFGDMPIDDDLIAIAGSDAQLATTTSGCICCTAGSDIITALEGVSEALDHPGAPAIGRVIVETTGLADPAPIINQLLRARHHTIGGRAYALAGVIATLDALRGETTVEQRLIGHKQIAFADRIAITKTDLHGHGDAGRLAALHALIARINPGAPVLDVQDSLALPGVLLEPRPYAPEARGGDVEAWLNAESPVARAFAQRHVPPLPVHRHTGIYTKSIVLDGLIDPRQFSAFLDMLMLGTGERLLRLKGLVALADDPGRPVLVHAVQGMIHPLHRLAQWPGPDRRTRLVLIADGIDADALARLAEALVPGPRRARA